MNYLLTICNDDGFLNIDNRISFFKEGDYICISGAGKTIVINKESVSQHFVKIGDK
jgi:hypothetical protein